MARVREITGGRGVDVVMDGVGAATFEESLDCLRPFGFMIAFGNASGPPPPLDIGKLSAKGSLKLTRQTLVHPLHHRRRRPGDGGGTVRDAGLGQDRPCASASASRSTPSPRRIVRWRRAKPPGRR